MNQIQERNYREKAHKEERNNQSDNGKLIESWEMEKKASTKQREVAQITEGVHQKTQQMRRCKCLALSVERFILFQAISVVLLQLVEIQRK